MELAQHHDIVCQNDSWESKYSFRGITVTAKFVKKTTLSKIVEFQRLTSALGEKCRLTGGSLVVQTVLLVTSFRDSKYFYMFELKINASLLMFPRL